MTEDKDFKKLVQNRAAKTGESYRAARAQLRPPTTDELDPKTRSNVRTVFNVPRSIGSIFTLAMDEARIARHPAVWPEHLLLAILDDGGAAAHALQDLRVNRVALRHALTRSLDNRLDASAAVREGVWVKPGAPPATRPTTQPIHEMVNETHSRTQGRPELEGGLMLLVVLAEMSVECRDALRECGATVDKINTAVL